MRDYIILGASVVLVCATLILFVQTLPVDDSGLAFDWKLIHAGIDGGRVHYGDGLAVPPWSVPLILPLGLLPMQTGWALIIALTLGALVAATVRPLPLLLLLTSFPVLRLIADGNLEAFVIFGILGIQYARRKNNPWLLGFAALLAVTKPQAVFLLLLVMADELLREKDWRFLVHAAVVPAIIGLPTVVVVLQPWLQAVGNLPAGVSFAAHDLPPFPFMMVVAVTMLRPSKQALIAASLLTAPYTNAHSMVVLLALGVVPLMERRTAIGIVLMMAYNLPYLVIGQPGYDVTIQPYWTALLLITWAVFVVERPPGHIYGQYAILREKRSF